MVHLTWNDSNMRISDLRTACLRNIGQQVAHTGREEHFICSVSDLMTFKTVNQSERTGFILKLCTSFESKYRVMVSYLVAVNAEGRLCLNERLQEFISLNLETAPISSAPASLGVRLRNALLSIRAFFDHLVMDRVL